MMQGGPEARRTPEPQRGEPTSRGQLLKRIREELHHIGIREYESHPHFAESIRVPQVELQEGAQALFTGRDGNIHTPSIIFVGNMYGFIDPRYGLNDPAPKVVLGDDQRGNDLYRLDTSQVLGGINAFTLHPLKKENMWEGAATMDITATRQYREHLQTNAQYELMVGDSYNSDYEDVLVIAFGEKGHDDIRYGSISLKKDWHQLIDANGRVLPESKPERDSSAEKLSPREALLQQIQVRVGEFEDGQEYMRNGLENAVRALPVTVRHSNLFEQQGKPYVPVILAVVHPDVMGYELPEGLHLTTPVIRPVKPFEDRMHKTLERAQGMITNLELHVDTHVAREFPLPMLDLADPNNPVFLDANAPSESSWEGKIPVGPSEDGKVHGVLVLLKSFGAEYAPIELDGNWKEMFKLDGTLKPAEQKTKVVDAAELTARLDNLFVNGRMASGTYVNLLGAISLFPTNVAARLELIEAGNNDVTKPAEPVGVRQRLIAARDAGILRPGEFEIHLRNIDLLSSDVDFMLWVRSQERTRVSTPRPEIVISAGDRILGEARALRQEGKMGPAQYRAIRDASMTDAAGAQKLLDAIKERIASQSTQPAEPAAEVRPAREVEAEALAKLIQENPQQALVDIQTKVAGFPTYPSGSVYTLQKPTGTRHAQLTTSEGYSFGQAGVPVEILQRGQKLRLTIPLTEVAREMLIGLVDGKKGVAQTINKFGVNDRMHIIVDGSDDLKFVAQGSKWDGVGMKHTDQPTGFPVEPKDFAALFTALH